MKNSKFQFHVITRADHPLFERAYAAMADYFGARGEMEERDVIKARFAWQEVREGVRWIMRYEIVVAVADDGTIAAVRDHSVIVDLPGVRDGTAAVVVHLSHILVMPRFRGRHLVDALHEFPIDAASRALRDTGMSQDTPVTLAAEVEHYIATDQERVRRLKLFRAMGYRPADPAEIPYCQPDFRSAEVIDATGAVVPVPLILMLWRVGRQRERTLPGSEVRMIVLALYEMYARGIAERHMLSAYETMDAYPEDGSTVSLEWSRVDRSLSGER